MRKTAILLLTGLLFGASTGCQKEQTPGCGPEEAGPYRVLVQLRERAPSAANPRAGAYLVCQDSKTYHTGSCQLQTGLTQTGNSLHLSFCGVGPCGYTDDTGPARGGVDLAHLPRQTYQLDITVRNRRTTGTLDLSVSPARLVVADTTVVKVLL